MNTETKSVRFATISAYISGGVCGCLWWPQAKGGMPLNVNLRAEIERFSDSSRATFRDVLMHVLMDKGADFQSALFTADTVIRVERRAVDGPGKYRTHVWERPVSALRDCSDLIDEESHVCDFLSEAA